MFPVLTRFEHEKKLPTTKSVIGVLRNLTENKYSHKQSITEVSKLIYAKYYHDTVFCIPIRSIERKMKKMWDDFREGRKRWASGQSGKAIERYKNLVEESEALFDVYAVDEERRKLCEREWGVKMTSREMEYYEDMKSGRQMECDHGVDPVWYTVMVR